VRFSTSDADLRLGDAGVDVDAAGRYVLRGRAREEHGPGALELDLVVTPAAGAYFPGAALGEGDSTFVSGYVVPGLRADADGTLCVDGACERLRGAQAYHDHNWGVWRGVTWEWGASRAGSYTFLYGRVHPPDGAAAEAPLFLYLVDSLGFRAVFRPRTIAYTDGRTIIVAEATGGRRAVRVPSRAVMADVRGDDTLRVELEIEDAIGTDTRAGLLERGDRRAARAAAHPYFIQMKGIARLTGRVGGQPIAGEGTGFFETYR
jgi:hypothetical protein